MNREHISYTVGIIAIVIIYAVAGYDAAFWFTVGALAANLLFMYSSSGVED